MKDKNSFIKGNEGNEKIKSSPVLSGEHDIQNIFIVKTPKTSTPKAAKPATIFSDHKPYQNKTMPYILLMRLCPDTYSQRNDIKNPYLSHLPKK